MPGMKLSEFKTPDDAVSGRWFDVGEGLRLKIARAGHQRFEDCVHELMRPYTKKRRQGKVKQSVINEVTQKAMARTILLGWENLLDEDGKEIPYSEQKAYEILSQFHDFFKLVERYSAVFSEEELELEEDAEGNLEGSSDGSSHGEETPSTSNSSSDASDAGDPSPPLTTDQNSTTTSPDTIGHGAS